MTKIYEIVDANNVDWDKYQEVLNVFRQPIYVRIKNVEKIKKAKKEGRNIK